MSEHKMPDGSWKCEKCNNINYPFRTKCNRQSYGADKPFEGHKSPSKPAEENNQVCQEIHLLTMNATYMNLGKIGKLFSKVEEVRN
ncbi:hypothetical protein CsSME_00005456 [Camellia sinensis var. sinensis]